MPPPGWLGEPQPSSTCREGDRRHVRRGWREKAEGEGGLGVAGRGRAAQPSATEKKGVWEGEGEGGQAGDTRRSRQRQKEKNVGRNGRARGGRRGRRGTRSTAVSVRWGWEGEGGRYQKARGGGGTLG